MVFLSQKERQSFLKITQFALAFLKFHGHLTIFCRLNEVTQ